MNKGEFHTRMYGLLGKIYVGGGGLCRKPMLFFVVRITPVTKKTNVFQVKVLCQDGATLDFIAGQQWLNQVTATLW